MYGIVIIFHCPSDAASRVQFCWLEERERCGWKPVSRAPQSSNNTQNLQNISFCGTHNRTGQQFILWRLQMPTRDRTSCDLARMRNEWDVVPTRSWADDECRSVAGHQCNFQDTNGPSNCMIIMCCMGSEIELMSKCRAEHHLRDRCKPISSMEFQWTWTCIMAIFDDHWPLMDVHSILLFCCRGAIYSCRYPNKNVL